MRRIVLFMVLLLGLLPLHSVSAHANAQQSVTWLAWTYDSLNGEMIQFDSTGFTRKSVILPTLAGYDYPQDVAVAPQGDRVAYTLTSGNQIMLAVYDLVNDTTLMSYSVPNSQNLLAVDSLRFAARPEVFSEDGHFLAFGYSVNNQWTLMTFDLNGGGSVAHQINSSALAAQGIGFGDEVPTPVWFDGNAVHFVMMPEAAGLFLSVPSFVWDLGLNAIVPTTQFPMPNASIETRTGEIIFPYLDDQFPYREDVMGFHRNTVHVVDPRVPLPSFPFYVDTGYIIEEAHFIQNGERVLIRVSEIDGDASGVYVMLNRDGSRADIFPYERLWIERIFGVGEGFVFSAHTAELDRFLPNLVGIDSTALVFVPTVGGFDTSTIDVLHVGIQGTTAKLVWALDLDRANRALPDAALWAQAQPTALGAPPSLPPVPPPSSSGGSTSSGGLTTDNLVVGGQARVTLEGANLNVRSNPTTSANSIGRLPALTPVDVIGGSQIADGFVWWQITDGIITGWSAAGLNGEIWLEVYTGQLPPPQLPPPPSDSRLPAPSLISPTDGNTYFHFTLVSGGVILPPLFEWESVAGASSYILELEACTPSCVPLIAFYTSATAYAIDITQYSFGAFRWRVIALDANSTTGIPSVWNSFTYSN